jgi:hypothetical protein
MPEISLKNLIKLSCCKLEQMVSVCRKMQAEKSYNYQKMSMKLNKQKGYEDI